MKDLEGMKKEDLIGLVVELECCLVECEKWVNKKKFKKGRKEEVLDILRRGKLVGVSDIAKEIGISSRNVSSQLSYLRDDGFEIVKVGRGHGKLKLIEE